MAFESPAPLVAPPPHGAGERPYLLERVDDAAIVQLYADGFSALPVAQKILVWHLAQAALAGRDIFYDQRYAHNLEMRDVLEAIVRCAGGLGQVGRAGRVHEEHGGGSEHPERESLRSSARDAGGGAPRAVKKDTPDAAISEILRYTKLFWLNTGPYNNLTARKFVLNCTPDEFRALAHEAAANGATFPLKDGETLDALLTRLEPMFFDPSFEPTVTCKTPPAGQDILQASANNLHVGITMSDLAGFEERYALNSRLVKREGTLVEEVYRAGGRYAAQISEIIRHLEAAIPYATPRMADALRALIRFYQTGEDADRQAYDIAWVRDQDSPVDTINGFIEVYLDARSMKGAWEALVFYVNPEKTREIRRIAENAQWFEDHMPWDRRYRKEHAHGVTANAIDVVIEMGDSGPITPVGINLPNDQKVREAYGSKSVSLSNVNEAYDKSLLPEFRTEFSWTEAEVDRARKWSAFASELTTNMHEVIGHGSGKVSERLTVSPPAALRENFSAIEEARADLVALYFLPDRKLAELGLVPEADHGDIVLAEYEAYARNALVQLRRVREGTQIEEDHMRNRQLIVHWLMANTSAIAIRKREGKTFYVMTDPTSFRDGVGPLLAEVQRIKAEGDYEAARALVDTYGVHFDASIRDEVVARVDRLNLPSYTGFVMPKLDPVRDDAGAIVDVRISYPLDFTAQMLEYSAATAHLRS